MGSDVTTISKKPKEMFDISLKKIKIDISKLLLTKGTVVLQMKK